MSDLSDDKFNKLMVLFLVLFIGMYLGKWAGVRDYKQDCERISNAQQTQQWLECAV